jgi:hypothetical protein
LAAGLRSRCDKHSFCACLAAGPRSRCDKHNFCACLAAGKTGYEAITPFLRIKLAYKALSPVAMIA